MRTPCRRCFVLILLHLLGCSHAPIEPAPESELVSDIAVRNLKTDDAIGSAIAIAPHTGFFAEISFMVKHPLPDFLGARRVKPPNEWPLSLVIYPRGDGSESDEAFYCCCNSLDNKGFVRPFCGVNYFWGDSGYHAPPTLKRSNDESKLQFWTYVAVPSMESTDYVYEVTLYPTSFWISDVRFDRGEPVVLKRGILSVTTSKTT